MHPAHVPLEIKTQAAQVGRPRDHRPRGGLFGKGQESRVFQVDNLVEPLQEIHGLQVLAPAILVGNPLAFRAGVVEVQHAGHGIHAQAVDVIHIGQEHGVGEQEGPDFVAAVVENQRAPVLVLALARIGMLVDVRAVKVRQPVPVLRKMRGHPVENDADPLLVAAVHEVLEIVRGPVTGGDGVIPDGLVAPRPVERMLGNRHHLDVRVAQLLHVREQLVRQLAVRQPAAVVLRHAHP